MIGFVTVFHTIVSVLMLVIILMQSGRGGGLTESFASAESMFGAKTNEFMIKATTFFAILFLITCLGLAVLSSQKGKSLMADMAIPDDATQTLETEVPMTTGSSITIDIGEEEVSSAQGAAPEQESPEAEPADVLPEPK